MGLFDRLFGAAGGGTRVRPVIAGHPELGPVIDKVAGRMDVAPARALFDKCRGRWHLRWLVVDAVRTHYVAKLAEGTRAQMIDAWIANTPGDPLAYLSRALFRIDAAWAARGRGATVTADAAARFAQHMAATAPDLARAAQLDPTDPTPHFIAMTAATALADADAARAAIEAAHAEVVARSPDHYLAHRRLVFLLSERWFGSHRDAVDAAHRLGDRAPDGSELPLLVLAAHADARAHLQFVAKDPRAARAYTERAAVAMDVDAAYDRSLGSPHHHPTDLTPYRRHDAALWFWATGDRERARTELTRVGDLFDADADPWHLPLERYLAIRKELGL